MRILGYGLLAVMALIPASYLAYRTNYPTYGYSYRLTIKVEVDGHIHEGASVYQVEWLGGPEIGDVGPYHPRQRGQAVFIDLGERGAIASGLADINGYSIHGDGSVSTLFLAPRAFGNDSSNSELPLLPQLRGRRSLTPDNMPLLVWFSDKTRPETARRFRVEEMAELLGGSARLLEAYVEITRDPIVFDIEKQLPWLGPWEASFDRIEPRKLTSRSSISPYMFIRR